MQIKYKVVIGVLMILAFASCSTSRKLANYEIKPMSANKIVRKVTREAPKYKTYEIKRSAITYQNSDKKTSFTGQIKINRDKCAIVTIRKMNMPLARGYISHDSIKMVNYFDKNYINDEIDVLKFLIGFKLEYSTLQALLTADTELILSDTDIDRDKTATIDSSQYRIDSQFNRKVDRAIEKGKERKLSKLMQEMDDSEFINYSAWIDPQLFIIRKMFITDIKKNQTITITYDDYKKIGRSYFPQQINLEVTTKYENIKLSMKMMRQAVNKEKIFSFNIPEKYDEFQVPRN
ncbi:MAG: DUF4292 domain-containing protein [Prolixibacteraceae bacterium]|jgi:hypothetical protein|nr:DUF4292 domain-containing protein [Prolixibacteraceae bacterium]